MRCVEFISGQITQLARLIMYFKFITDVSVISMQTLGLIVITPRYYLFKR